MTTKTLTEVTSTRYLRMLLGHLGLDTQNPFTPKYSTKAKQTAKVLVSVNDNIWGIAKNSDHAYLYDGKELAVSPVDPRSNTAVNLEEFKEMLKNSLKKAYRGAYGGTFTIDDRTPLWISRFGSGSNYRVTGFIDTENSLILQVEFSPKS